MLFGCGLMGLKELHIRYEPGFPQGKRYFEDGILGHPGTSLAVNILGDSQGAADDLLTTVTAAACQ